MNKQKLVSLIVILVVTLSMVGLTTNAAASRLAATAPSLGAASSFSVLAGLSMSAAGAGTTVSGDLGLSPGLEISKTGPWTVGGSQYFGPTSNAGDAQTAALGAFNNLAGQTSNGVWGGAINPVPGVWTDASDTTFTGTLTLTGGYDDVWVIQVGGDLTFSGSVVLGGNAQACNVFWQIGRDVTIASGSSFIGTVIASRDITLVSGATVNGRILSLNGTLTTDGNNISGPSCASAPVTQATTTLLPGVSGLPSTGGGPIQNESFPWVMLIVGGFSLMVISLGVREYRRTRLLK
jgi:hypothetical protein